MRISDWSSDVCSSDLSSTSVFVSGTRANGAVINSGPTSTTSTQTASRPWLRPGGDVVSRNEGSLCASLINFTLFSDRKSTRLNPVTNAQLVCRLLLEKKTQHTVTTLINQHTRYRTIHVYLTT